MYDVPIKEITPVERPAGVPTIPVNIGVFYEPELHSHVHNHFILGADRLAFPLGEASVRHFDEVFAASFKRTTAVDVRPPFAVEKPELVAVIELRIEHFSYDFRVTSTGPFTIDITYRFILYSPKGATIASWTVSGSEGRKIAPFEGSRKLAGELTEAAMREATAEFMKGFQNVPEVRSWLNEIRSAATSD